MMTAVREIVTLTKMLTLSIHLVKPVGYILYDTNVWNHMCNIPKLHTIKLATKWALRVLTL